VICQANDLELTFYINLSLTVVLANDKVCVCVVRGTRDQAAAAETYKKMENYFLV
jgi:hypothetical protein